MISAPLVSAIVLFHDRRSANEALSCIKALQEQTITAGTEIILVDNGTGRTVSESLHALLGKGDPIAMVRSQENIGYGKGNNLGVERTAGEYILIINPDNRLEPGALETMVQFLGENGDVGIVGPQLVFPDGTIRDSYRTFPTITDVLIKRTLLRYLFKNRMQRYLQWGKNPHEQRDVDWLCGACLLLRRDLYQEMGGFDRKMFLFFEDTDLCRRTWEKGLRVVYLPQAKAHDSQLRLSSGGMFSFLYKRTVRIHIASAIRYFWKWRGKKVPGLV